VAGRTLTDVPGLAVGHATRADSAGVPATGCTVILGPFRAVAEVRGMGTGSRELGVLEPEHLVPRVDGVLFTGGSAFGLAAADGVMAWLQERGRGYDTGAARVPIVPAAVIYDLRPDGDHPTPDAELGRLACDAASDAPVPQGPVGCGAGATVAKLAGLAGASPGGVGSAATQAGPWTVGALAVVNALGEVRDGDGGVMAGARGSDGVARTAGELARAALAEGGTAEGAGLPGSNTTLCLVATDAPLDSVDLRRLARVAANALPRRIHPVNTPFDGDVVVAVSTAEATADIAPDRLLGLATLAQETLEQAITRGVVEGRRRPGAVGP